MTQHYHPPFDSKESQYTKHLLLIIPAVIGFFITVALIHLILLSQDRENLYFELHKAKYENGQLYREISAVFSNTKLSNSPPCTKDNLDIMRNDLWGKKYLQDIAYIQNNHILCSANWGVFKQPIPLTKETELFLENTKHWRNVPDPIKDKKNINMVSIGHILILIKSDQTKFSYQNKNNISIAFKTLKSNYIFRSYGDIPAEDLAKAKTGSTLTTMTEKSCSEKQRMCIIIQNNNMGLLGTSRKGLAFTLVISLLVGLTLSYVVYLTRTRRHSILHHLKRAIANESIYIRYQPKLCLTSKRVIGVEALARWHDTNFGKVPPDIFIELAEKNNLIKKLSRLVIKRSISDMSPLMQKYPDLTLSINLSMEDITEPSLLDYINEQAKKNNIAHDRLIFEITERTNQGFELIEKSVKCFTKVGYKISLDDFGTGYANLSWLSKIQPHEIKVDKTFTQSIGTDSINQNMLNAIFILLQELDVDIVFEGIETQEQMNYLLSRSNMAIGQGWLFARPMKPSLLADFIEKQRPLSIEGPKKMTDQDSLSLPMKSNQ